MANRFSYQVLKDDTQFAVIKLTGSFDGSGQEDNNARVAANTLYGALDANNVPLRSALSVSNTAKPYYGLTVNRIWFDTPTGASTVELYWANTAATSADEGTPLVFLQSNGEYDAGGSWVTIQNPVVNANNNGDIAIKTKGLVANTTYTIILELRKDNAYYQRGQFNDPAAFNFGEYSIRP
jgi:hypothetical protein